MFNLSSKFNCKPQSSLSKYFSFDSRKVLTKLISKNCYEAHVRCVCFCILLIVKVLFTLLSFNFQLANGYWKKYFLMIKITLKKWEKFNGVKFAENVCSTYKSTIFHITY